MSLPPPSPKQAKVIWFALTALAVALSVAILGAVIWGLGQLLVVLSPVLWPLAVAGVIAFILDPVVGWLCRHRVPRLRAILLVFGAAAVLVLGLFGSVVPQTISQARDLVDRIPSYAEVARSNLVALIDRPQFSVKDFLATVRGSWGRGPGATNGLKKGPAEGGGRGGEAPGISPTNGFAPLLSSNPAAGGTNAAVAAPSAGAVGVSTNASRDLGWWVRAFDPKALRTAGDWLATVLPEVGRWMVGQVGRLASLFGILAGLALIPIYAFYFLLEKSSIERQWRDYLPVSDSRFKDELVWLLSNINDALIVFFRGQVLVAICDGILYATGFLLIGLPYSLLLGVIATVLTIVPFLGAIVTCVTALIIAAVQFGDWQHPLLVLGVFVAVQTVEGWLIQPKIIGDRVGLHPITIIIALLVGTTLMGGLLGGLLAIPATAVLRALMFRYVWRSGHLGNGGLPPNG